MKIKLFEPIFLDLNNWDNSLYILDNKSIDFGLNILSSRMYNSKISNKYEIIINPYVATQYYVYTELIKLPDGTLRNEIRNPNIFPELINLSKNAISTLDKIFIELINTGYHRNQELLVNIKRSNPSYSVRIDNFNRLVFMTIPEYNKVILSRIMFHYDDKIIPGTKDYKLKETLLQLFQVCEVERPYDLDRLKNKLMKL